MRTYKNNQDVIHLTRRSATKTCYELDIGEFCRLLKGDTVYIVAGDPYKCFLVSLSSGAKIELDENSTYVPIRPTELSFSEYYQ